MWRDLAWGLAAAVALLFAGATIMYALQTASDLNGDDKKDKKLVETNPGLFNASDSDGLVEAERQHARTRYRFVPLAPRYRNKTGTPGPQEAYGATDEPDKTSSSPYLFQPIRYKTVTKDKRSVFREYTDG